MNAGIKRMAVCGRAYGTSGARRGSVNRKVVLAVGGAVAVFGAITWLGWGMASAEIGEQDIPLTFICASCSHPSTGSYKDMMRMIEKARRAGITQVGTDGQAVGVCRKCKKAALYPATPCDKCGQAMLPAHAAVEGNRIAAKCPNCGASH